MPAGTPWPPDRLQEMGAPPVEASTCPTCPVRVKLMGPDCGCAAVVSAHVPERLFTEMPPPPMLVTKASFVFSSSIVTLPPAHAVHLGPFTYFMHVWLGDPITRRQRVFPG